MSAPTPLLGLVLKFRTSKEDFADAASWVAKQLPARAVVPILSGVKIVAADGKLVLAGYDYETSTEVTVSAEIDVEGVVLVSGKLLADITKSLPSKPLDARTDGNTLLIQCGSSKFTLPTMSVEDYPQLPDSPQNSGSINAEVYAQAIAQVSIAAGKDESLPMLTGVFCVIEGHKITLAATDRFRLAVRELEWAPGADMPAELSALIPAKALADTAKTSSGIGDVALAIGDGAGLFGFIADGRSVTTRLLDAEFPKFRQLIPAEHTTLAVVEIKPLVDAVKRMAVVAERGAQVRLTFEGDTVTLASGGAEGSGEEVLPAVLSGPGIHIAFNPSFLSEALNSIDADYVQMGFTKPGRPAIMRAADGEIPEGDGPFVAGHSDFLTLLMPVRLPDTLA
ncbi:DNA polymerase III subunit beta [Rhodococcus fascians]|nr:DNA polymerase III subunit beta [Rhodococcus fascians]MBY4237740.1 DNA polymerase III subunit beta [Rhodococcus fascians]MBY4253943.1 DNA polymerase III subunit beta [Rhodococcus fascians]MBY4269186.1 DNA polymerase III subunit beta [Rhodococcus fascians]